MEYLRWACRRQYVNEFGGGRPGTCPHCGVYAISDLDEHIINHHLELGQLWRCPVEWCTVWEGSVHDCLYHLRSKHSGTRIRGLKPLGKFFPLWTVPREFWKAALRSDVSQIATDVNCSRNRYRVYIDPMPHVSLWDGMIRKIPAFVHRTMAIAQLTHLYPFQSQTVLAYQPHSVLNASDFVESETSNAFDLRSPEDLFTDAPDDLL